MHQPPPQAPGPIPGIVQTPQAPPQTPPQAPPVQQAPAPVPGPAQDPFAPAGGFGADPFLGVGSAMQDLNLFAGLEEVPTAQPQAPYPVPAPSAPQPGYPQQPSGDGFVDPAYSVYGSPTQAPAPQAPAFQGDGQQGPPPVGPLAPQQQAPPQGYQPGYVPVPQASAPQGPTAQPTPQVGFPEMPTAPVRPTRPTKPERPEKFDAYEAENDPASESAKYVAAHRQYQEDIADFIADSQTFAESQVAYEQQLAAYQQQARGVVAADFGRTYGLSPQEANAFYDWASSPTALEDSDAWLHAFRFVQQRAAQQHAQAPQAGYPQQPQVAYPQAGYPQAPTQQFAYGPAPQAPYQQQAPFSQPLPPQQVPGMPPAAPQAFQPYAAPQTVPVQAVPVQTGAFPPSVGAQPGFTGRAIAPEDVLMQQMLAMEGRFQY